MARPTIYHRPMTNAERMRRYRARKKEPQQPRLPTVRELAQGKLVPGNEVSERTMYYCKVARTGFDKDFWYNYRTGKYRAGLQGIGIQFLAEVVQFGTIRAQQLVREAIERKDAATARALWRKLIRRGKRYAKLRQRREASAEYHRFYAKHGRSPLPWWLRDRP